MEDINLFRTKDSIFLKKVKSKSDLSVSDISDGYLIEASENEARKIIEFLKGRTSQVPSSRRGKIIAVVGGDTLSGHNQRSQEPSAEGKNLRAGSVFNRRAIETLKIDYLVSPERGLKNDGLKQRDSGLNHVVAEKAKKKGIVMVIDFGEVSGLEGKAKALRLSRLIQNIRVCRKAKCPIKIASFAEAKKDVIDGRGLRSFGISLGMSGEQSRDAIRF